MKLYLLLAIKILFLVQYYGQDLAPSIHLDIENGIKQNGVNAILEDDYGRVWIGSSGGLQYYTGFEIVDFPQINERVVQLYISDSELFCLTIKGLYKINIKNMKFDFFKFPKTEYYLAAFEKEKILLSPTEQNSFIVLDYNLKEVKESDLLLPKYGFEIQLGSNRIKCNKKGLQILGNQPYFITKSYCLDYSYLHNNRVFVSSHSGLFDIQVKDGKIETKTYFADTRLECTFIDKNHNLWIGTSEKGLYMVHYNTLKSNFKAFQNKDNEPLLCWNILEIKDSLFVSTSNGIFALSDYNQLDIKTNLTKDKIIFCGASEGDIVLLGGPDGIYMLNKNTFERIYFNETDVLDAICVQIIKNEQGFLACTKKSFVQFDKQGKLIYSKRYAFKTTDVYVMHLKPTSEGYTAATTNGLYYLDNNLDVIKSYQTLHSRVISQITDTPSSIWLASMDGGLSKFENDSIVNYPFIDQQLLTITSQEEQLWISSITSIFSYENGIARPYTNQNGFPIREYSQNGFYKDHLMHYIGVGGVFSFNPDSLTYLPNMPNMLIKRKGEIITPKDSINLNYDQSELILSLQPILISDQNLFEISYKKNNKWVEIKKPNLLNLEMQEGFNTFEIRIKNTISGEEEIQSFSIFRALPFWKKLWFILLSVVLIIALLLGVFSFVKYINTKKKLRSELQQKKITNERLRISKELHDNIGARLTHIISSLDVEVYQQKEDITALNNINKFARETMSQLRETIWAVNEKTIFFSEFAKRIAQYIYQVNSMSKSQIVFTEGTYKDIELNPIQTINYYRITQEAINNAVKYSNASLIHITIEEVKEEILITIEDDGCGFEYNQQTRGTGLKGMKSRATEAGGTLEISSTLEKGTRIKISVKNKD